MPHERPRFTSNNQLDVAYWQILLQKSVDDFREQ